MREIPYQILEVNGSPYRRGYKYGSLIKSSLKEFLQKEFYGRWDKRIDEMHLFSRKCMKVMEKYLPKTMEFIHGFSDGSGLSVEEIVMIQCHEEFVHGLELNSHCSAIAVAPSETVDRKT